MTKTTPNKAPELMTIAEAVEMLRMRRQTIVDLVKRGEIPGRKLGREWRISRSQLLRYVEGPSVQHAR